MDLLIAGLAIFLIGLKIRARRRRARRDITMDEMLKAVNKIVPDEAAEAFMKRMRVKGEN